MTIISKTALAAAALAAAMALSACEPQPENGGAAGPLNAIDENNLNQIMLTVADPENAVEYFRRSLQQQPDRVEFKRGYALALMRNRQWGEARLAYRELVEAGQANAQDRVEYAHALARLDQWDEVEAQLTLVPDEHNTARRRLIEAMLSDHREDWAAADAAYERARALTPRPASVMNNWGVSKMARGDFKGAEEAFEQAILLRPDLFSAKNNLTIAYGLQRKYRLPLLTLTEEERAILLHNLAVVALRQGDRDVARGLLSKSVELHPRHYPAAASKLAALGAVVEN